MQDKLYTIRVMTRDEVDLAVDWAANESWNPGLNDAECYYKADKDGFLIGILNGEPIATISAVKYGNAFGFIGFYMVKPEYRGKGYGIQIWNAGLDYLKGCTVGLDGVLAQQNNYKKSGFQFAYRNIRYQGVTGGSPSDNDIVDLTALPFEMIDRYDCKFFPESRSGFVKSWINQPNAIAQGIIAGDKLEAYGVIRQCRDGYKIGPLYANKVEQAKRLFESLKSSVKSSEAVYLDAPEINPEAVALAESYGMNVSFETARMYTQKRPVMPIDRIFGVTSFEIG